MDKRLLKLTPVRYLCPHCGKWHKWDEPHELGYYDSNPRSAGFRCTSLAKCYLGGQYYIFFEDGYCYYETQPMCAAGWLRLNGKIKVDLITESSEKPIVTFKVKFKPQRRVGSDVCSSCGSVHTCNLVALADKGYGDHMEITLGFEFEYSDYNQIVKINNQQPHVKENKKISNQQPHVKENKKISNQQPHVKENKKISNQQPHVKENKEETTMANNIFNINMEFGPNKDENIASTLMGIAVKNGDSWRIYDKKKKEITDVGNMQLGNLPIFILPTTELSEGDLIKDDGEYYFVMKVDTGSTQTLCAKTGEMKTVIPIKNVLGFSCYMKVIALSDSLNIEDDFEVEKLAIMSAMYDQSGENSAQMNQLLPLLLFKDKLSGDDDIKNLLLMSYMMPAQTKDGVQNGTMNQLLPLLLFKDKIGKNDDMMKLLLISSMTGGNMTDSNSPLVSYLMLDSFINTNDKKNSNQDGNNNQDSNDD